LSNRNRTNMPRTLNGSNFTESASRSLGKIFVKNITVNRDSDLPLPSVILSATHGITTGDITSQGGAIEATTTIGNIKMGHISSMQYLASTTVPTRITANLGNIEVDSLQAVNSSKPNELILDIYAGGTFRAIGTIKKSIVTTVSGDRYSTNLGLLALGILGVVDLDVGKFASSKTRLTQSDFAKFAYRSKYYVVTPVSIATDNAGAIRIRYAGGSGPINRPNGGVELQGGNSRFEIGGKAQLGIGDPYVPYDSSRLG
jgi:hypothetical protein